MAMEGMLVLGIAAAVSAVAVLRLSWGRPARHVALNAVGWAFAAIATIVGGAYAGAWGIAVISLWAMGAAAVLLAWSAWRAPSSGTRAASNRRAGMLPQGDEPARIGGRIATFLIVVVGGIIASVALAVASRWLAMATDANEANANVAALFVAPLGWTILTFVLLITPSRKRQIALILSGTATAVPAILTGSLM